MNFCRFEFHDDFTFNQQIQPKARVNLQPIIQDWQRQLPLNVQPSLVQFMNQTRFINRFQEAGSKL